MAEVRRVMGVEKVEAGSGLAMFVVRRGVRLGVEGWKARVVCSARAVIRDLVRRGDMEPPVGVSAEVAEAMLGELFEPPGGREVESAIIPLTKAEDGEEIVILLRFLAVAHCYCGERKEPRAEEMMGLLDRASELLRGSELEAGWMRLVRYAQVWREVGGDKDVVFWVIDRGVTDFDACELIWRDEVLGGLEQDSPPWEERYTELVARGLRMIGEGEMAELYVNDFEEYWRRFRVGREKLFGEG